MAISQDGPLGPFKGKLGPLYGYIVNGRQILRAAPHPSKKPRSIKQKAQEQKVQVLTPFFTKIKAYLSIGFELSAMKRNINSNNAAKSYNLKYGIKGEYPDQEIDYAGIRLTEGSLDIPAQATASSVEGGIKFSWAYDADGSLGDGADKTMLLVFFKENRTAFYFISGAYRMNGEEILPLNDRLRGQTAETYISFVTDDRKSISNSVYTGSLVF